MTKLTMQVFASATTGSGQPALSHLFGHRVPGLLPDESPRDTHFPMASGGWVGPQVNEIFNLDDGKVNPADLLRALYNTIANMKISGLLNPNATMYAQNSENGLWVSVRNNQDPMTHKPKLEYRPD
jgi:hypothetical protein